jgi:ribosomal protein S14
VKNIDKALKLVEELSDYELVEVINNQRIILKHNCGNVWGVNVGHFLNGSRCPNNECRQKRYKETMIEKYGVENPSQLNDVKEKKKETFIKHYGVDCYLTTKECKNKIIEKYGIDNVSKLDFIKEKKKETFIEHYGTDNIFKTKEFIEENTIKMSKTKLEKYYNNVILNYKDVSPLFTKEEYIGTLTDNKKYTIYKWKCNICGNEFESTIRSAIPICRKCNPLNVSSGEKEIQYFLNNYNLNFESNKRFYYGSNRYHELDIFFPDKNIGIEYNGNYWHSELNGKDKHYHLNKTLYFENQGIQILHFFENEWLEKQQIIKSIIKSKLGLIINKIYARNTVIKEVSSKDAKEFLDNNHLQGSINSSIKLGLYYGKHLVSIMAFGKSRHNKNYEYELLRFANKCNINVIGGFSKLLKYFITTYLPKSIITYADRRLSNGNVYEKNGFSFLHNSQPNYYYTKYYRKLYNRLNFQKHKLSNKLKIFNSELTEWENMQLNNYDRIWDCGNKVYYWRKNDL